MLSTVPGTQQVCGLGPLMLSRPGLGGAAAAEPRVLGTPGGCLCLGGSVSLLSAALRSHVHACVRVRTHTHTTQTRVHTCM